MKRPKLALGLAACLLGSLGRAHADEERPAVFKSPSGQFEVTFVPATGPLLRIYEPAPGTPADQKPQYVIYFHVAKSSELVTYDWYTDVTPPKAPADIFPTMLWSPQEDFVLLRRGQNAREPGFLQRIISLRTRRNTGFEGDHLRWVDRDRLIADVNTKKIPGGVEVINAKLSKAELVVSPEPGVGYAIAQGTGPRITVRSFMNHWGEEHEKTSWEFLEPSCFELDLDTMKKRSVACPVKP